MGKGNLLEGVSSASQAMLASEAMDLIETCSGCGKPAPLCVCASLQQIKTKTRVLILQHPQEPDKHIGSAELLHRALPNSTLRVGLSWRNLGHALGEEVDPKAWMVLYLGSAKVEAQAELPAIVRVSRNGNALSDEDARRLPRPSGIVLLDGTWSQAKTLWWRNAWLLKLQRAVVIPKSPSLYGSLRKEPRPDSVSTIESAAIALSIFERDPAIFTKLMAPFSELLSKIASHPEFRPIPRKRPQGRHGRGRSRGYRRSRA